jgi:hypothetical protein
VVAAQGEKSGTDIFDDDGYRPTHENIDVTTPPTGVPRYTYTVHLLGEWSPLDWLTLALQPGYRIVNNYGHVSDKLEHGFECVFSTRVQLGKR